MILITIEWGVRIVCDDYERLKNMSGSIDTPYMSISSINDEILLRSNKFDKCVSASQVVTIGEQLLKTLYGLISVNSSLPKLKNVRINGVVDITNNHYYIFASDRLDLASSVTVVNGVSTPKNIKNDPNKWIELIEIDDTANKIFNYARLGIDNPFVMYDIFELIREDVKKDFTKINGKYTRQVMSTFTGSINDPRVMGEESRHAVPEGKKEMTRTMTKDECRGFATELLHEWIHYKLSIYKL